MRTSEWQKTEGSEIGRHTLPCVRSSLTGLRSNIIVPTYPSMSNMVLKFLQNEQLHIKVLRILTDDPHSLEGRLKAAEDEALKRTWYAQ